jgi:hypothetical protein
MNVEASEDLARDLALNLEDVRHFPIVSIGPDGTIARDLAELDSHSNSIARASYTALKHVADAETLTDPFNGQDFAFERERCRGRSHDKIFRGPR